MSATSTATTLDHVDESGALVGAGELVRGAVFAPLAGVEQALRLRHGHVARGEEGGRDHAHDRRIPGLHGERGDGCDAGDDGHEHVIGAEGVAHEGVRNRLVELAEHHRREEAGEGHHAAEGKRARRHCNSEKH